MFSSRGGELWPWASPLPIEELTSAHPHRSEGLDTFERLAVSSASDAEMLKTDAFSGN